MISDLVGLSSSLSFIDELYQQYCETPQSVDPSWHALFNDETAQPAGQATAAPGESAAPRQAAQPRQTAEPRPSGGPRVPDRPALAARDKDSTSALSPAHRKALSSLHSQAAAATSGGPSVWPLINAYRVRGHLAATLDPLNMLVRPRTVELEPETYGFVESDYDREYSTAGLHGVERATLRDILAIDRKSVV